MMKASSMDFANLYDFENEFQFQLYKDIRRRRVASTWKVTRPCDLNHMAGHVQPENTIRRSIATFTSPDCYASLPRWQRVCTNWPPAADRVRDPHSLPHALAAHLRGFYTFRHHLSVGCNRRKVVQARSCRKEIVVVPCRDSTEIRGVLNFHADLRIGSGT